MPARETVRCPPTPASSSGSAAPPSPAAAVRFRANGYSLYARRSNLPLARLRLTSAGDEVVVLYPAHRGWQALGDFGTVPMPLDHALEMISTNPYFRQLRQDFE